LYKAGREIKSKSFSVMVAPIVVHGGASAVYKGGDAMERHVTILDSATVSFYLYRSLNIKQK